MDSGTFTQVDYFPLQFLNVFEGFFFNQLFGISRSTPLFLLMKTDFGSRWRSANQVRSTFRSSLLINVLRQIFCIFQMSLKEDLIF